MLIHIFMFRWKPEASEDQKNRASSEIRKLQGQIPGWLETYVGRNLSPRGQDYKFGGVMKFPDKAAFDSYNSHPAHQRLLSWLMLLIEPLEIDFEA